MLGTFYFGQPYFAQGNDGSSTASIFSLATLVKTMTSFINGIRTTRRI